MKISRLSLFCLGALAFQLAACTPTAPTPMVITVVVPATAIPPTGGTSISANGDVNTADAQPTLSETAAEVADTETAQPADTEAAATGTVGPQCTIKQNVNFRSGPGKAYDPPVDALTAGMVVQPQAYQAQGYPGGSWVQVLNPANNKTGWVSAGADFITCTIDLTSLPGGDYPPTPKPSGPILSNSQPKGNFKGFFGSLHFSSNYLVSLEVYRKKGDNSKDGDGIQTVTFTVNSKDGPVRVQTEKNAPYCVFGGGGGCASWPKVNGKYAWTPNGPLVEDGTYRVNIHVEAKDGTTANWNFNVSVDVP